MCAAALHTPGSCVLNGGDLTSCVCKALLSFLCVWLLRCLSQHCAPLGRRKGGEGHRERKRETKKERRRQRQGLLNGVRELYIMYSLILNPPSKSCCGLPSLLTIGRSARGRCAGCMCVCVCVCVCVLSCWEVQPSVCQPRTDGTRCLPSLRSLSNVCVCVRACFSRVRVSLVWLFQADIRRFVPLSRTRITGAHTQASRLGSGCRRGLCFHALPWCGSRWRSGHLRRHRHEHGPSRSVETAEQSATRRGHDAGLPVWASGDSSCGRSML